MLVDSPVWLTQTYTTRAAEPAPLEWADHESDFGRQHVLACTLRLACGHMYRTASAVPVSEWPEARFHLRDSLARKLRATEAKHDCATFEDEEAVKRVTARLTRAPRRS